MATAATAAAAGDSSGGHEHRSSPLTDTEVINLAKQSHLHPYVLSPSSHSTLLSYLHTRSRSPAASAAVSEYTLSLLSLISLSPNNPNLSFLLSSLLTAYTKLFLPSQFPHDRNSLRTINLFTTLLSYVPADDLESVVELVVDGLSNLVDSEDTQILDILPGCFRCLCGEKGKECVSLILDRIIESEWSKGLLVRMVFLVRDILGFFDKVRARELLEKVFKGMKGVDLQDLPSLAYQLLVLASRGFSKMEVIQGIVRFFGFELGSKASSTVRQVEGTVLLHVNFAVKQDPSLAKEVIGIVKSDPSALNHFTVAILLSVARIKRFSESSIEVLKAALFTAHRNYRFSRNCTWLPDDLKGECLQNVQTVESATLRAINESNYGREHIVPSIVKLSFTLLESSEGHHGELGSDNGLMGVEALSVQILKTLFEVHDMSRNEIIEQCKFRILSLKPEQSIPIVRLLCFLVKSYPYPMLEHASRLKELLDYFTFMHGSVSSNLVAALVPLIKSNRDLRDYTILVVRKAMFRQEETVCLAATNAIINVILAEKQSKRDSSLAFQDSSSQASCSQQAELFGGYGVGLFQEWSCLLQRCFYQQAKVKEAMYYGLLKLVLVDPESGRAAFDFLSPHFLKFFKEDADVQLGISNCIKSDNDKVVIQEPLDCLLSCVSWLLLLQPHDKADHPDSSWACLGFSLSQDTEAGRHLSSESFSKCLLKIRDFLKKPRLEDILGSTQDSGSTPLEQEKRKCFALVLSGIIEVVLNIIVSELEKATGSKRIDLVKEILELVSFHHSLKKYTSIKKSCGIKRGNPVATCLDTSINTKLPQERIPVLSTSSLCQLIQSEIDQYNKECSKAFKASQNNSQLSSREMLNCFKTISFVLNKCLDHIRSYPTGRKEDPVKTLVYGDINSLGSPLLKLICLLNSGSNCTTNQKKDMKGKKDIEDRRDHLRLALLCLNELVTVSLKNSPSSCLLEDLLSSSTLEYELDEEREEASMIDDQLTRNKVSFLAKFLRPLMKDLLAESLFNETEIVCDMMATIGSKLPSRWRNSFASWCINICKSNRIKDQKAGRSVVGLAISLSSPPDDLAVAQCIAKELLDVNGYAEFDPTRKKPSEMSELYPIINKATSSAISSSLLKLIEEIIADMDWSVKKLKTSYLAEQKNICFGQSGEHASILVLEDNLFSRAEAVVKVLSSFVLMNLNDTQAEHLLRLSAKFYKHLAMISRLRIAPKGSKQLIPSQTFQRLVESTCKHLTAPLYKFIADTQMKQQENPNAKGMINKIKRENKCIPDLIFQIEDYEKYLIRLSKLSKINLLIHAKRSTSRDFKILEPGSTREAAPNPGHNNETAAASPERSQENSGSIAENEEYKVLSPETDSLAAEDSDNENGFGLPDAKRMKRNNVVMDSDDSSDEL